MEEHLKHGLVFAVLLTVALLMLNAVAWTGVETATTISRFTLLPLMWFWDLLGISGCQAMGHLVFIFLSIPVYYLLVGFIIGFLFSLCMETILTRKEEKRYSK